MNFGVAIPAAYFGGEQVAAMTDRVHRRGGVFELRFTTGHLPAVLPVLIDGNLTVAKWGADRTDGARLPPSKFTRWDSVETGKWAMPGASLEKIPASHVEVQGVWQECGGLLAVVVRHPDDGGQPWAWVVVQPADRYHEVMCKCEWMPVSFVTGGSLERRDD